MDTQSANEIKQEVRNAYGRVALRFVEAPVARSCCGPAQEEACCDESAATTTKESCCGEPSATATEESCCSGESAQANAIRLGYAAEELEDLPGSVTGASLGCGNPTALASLQPGEVVLDLGSGGGIDCFLAAKKVGPTGRVIGLDMTTEMIKLARRNAKKMGIQNVDFRYGEMEEMPLPDESVDVIISNCVINLSPDKDTVFAEAFRVLKPGGRMSVSDIVTHGPLPDVLAGHMRTWAGCVSGALDIDVYQEKMRAAGLTDIEITSQVDLQVAGLADSPDVQEMLARLDPPLSVE